MADQFISSVAVKIVPTFDGFHKAIQSEMRRVMPSTGSDAGRDLADGINSGLRSSSGDLRRAGARAGDEAAEGFERSGKDGGEEFVDEAADEIRGGRKELERAADRASSGMVDEFDKAGKSSGNSFKSGLLGVMAGVAGAIAALGIGQAIGDSIGLASEVEQGRGAADSIFGTGSQQARGNAAGAGSRLGLSEAQYLESATLLGAQGKNLLGLEGAELSAWVDQMMVQASDMAAMFGGTTQDAVGALSSSLRGEYNAIERYGVTVTASMADASAAAQGLSREQAVLGLISEQTASSQGQFAAEADTFAGATQRLSANIDNLKTRVGEALLPVLTDLSNWVLDTGLPALEDLGRWLKDEAYPRVVDFGNAIKDKLNPYIEDLKDWVSDDLMPALNDFGGWLKEHKEEILAVGAGVLAATAAYKGYTTALKIQRGVLIGLTAVQAAYNAVAALNPTTLIIIAIVVVIGLLVAAFVYLWRNSETFREGVIGVWDKIKAAISFAWNDVIKPVFNAIWGFIRDTLIPIFQYLYTNVIQPVWNGIKFAIDQAWTIIKIIFDAIVYFVENTLAPKFNWFYDSVISPVMGWIEDRIQGMWDFIKPIFEGIGNFLKDTVGPAVRTAIETIGGIFTWLANLIRRPINFVIDYVWNKGIVWLFNKLAEAVDSDHSLDTVDLIQPFGQTAQSRGPASHNGAMQAHAEGGLTKKGLGLVGELGPEVVDYDNPARVYTTKQLAAAMRYNGIGGQGERASGLADKEPIITAKGVSPSWLDKTVDFVRGGLAWVADKVLEPARMLIRASLPEGGNFTGLMRDGALGFADDIVDWVRGEDEEYLARNASIIGKNDPQFIGAAGAAGGGGRAGRVARSGRISSPFGVGRYGGTHAGLDIAMPIGSPLYAPWDGIVQRLQTGALAGRTGKGALLGHPGGMQTYWGHLSMGGHAVRVGQEFRKGQLILRSGNTGRSTGPHLHIETHPTGIDRPVNPARYGLFDDGGWMNPGMAGRNLTNKPEPVFTNEQWRSIETLASIGARNVNSSGQVYQSNVTLNGASITAQDVANETLWEMRGLARSGGRI